MKRAPAHDDTAAAGSPSTEEDKSWVVVPGSPTAAHSTALRESPGGPTAKPGDSTAAMAIPNANSSMSTSRYEIEDVIASVERDSFRPRSSSLPGLGGGLDEKTRALSRSSFASDGMQSRTHSTDGTLAGIDRGSLGSPPRQHKARSAGSPLKPSALQATEGIVGLAGRATAGSAIGSRRRFVRRFKAEERSKIDKAREAAQSIAAAARILRGRSADVAVAGAGRSLKLRGPSASDRSRDLKLLEQIVPLEWAVDANAATQLPTRRHVASARLLGGHHRRGSSQD